MVDPQIQSNLDAAQAAKDLIEIMLPEIRQTIAVIKTVLGQHLGISPARVILLEQLGAREEISQAEIQRKLGVGGAVITRIIKQMEAEGLITRRPDPADNRFTLVRLTDQGQSRRDEVVGKLHMIGITLLAGINADEMRCMQASLAHIQKNAESLVMRNEAASFFHQNFDEEMI